MKITSKTGGGLMISDVSPKPRAAEVTVESIDYFLSQIREVPIDQAMRICELEDRFTQAKQGLYEPPPELQPPTEKFDAAPELQPPTEKFDVAPEQPPAALALVPQPSPAPEAPAPA